MYYFQSFFFIFSSILNPPPRQIVRSRSSVPSLGAQIPENKPSQPSTEKRRPKLVKQKQSIYDEAFVLPEENFTDETKPYLRKQSSLNEELMAENRIREKERVRKRIQKQISLNEAFLCRSVFRKRLQVIASGLSSKLKTSTGSLERVTKNSFVKIMQNFKNSQDNSDTLALSKDSQTGSATTTNVTVSGTIKYGNNNDEEPKTRRHSRESGSGMSLSLLCWPDIEIVFSLIERKFLPQIHRKKIAYKVTPLSMRTASHL